MKTLVNWLLRLYPRSWLDRYETEFRTLLDDAMLSWIDVIDVFKEGVIMRLTTGLALQSGAFGFAAMALAGAALWFAPAPYESHAVIYTRSAILGVPKTPDQMRVLTQRAMSEKRLANIIDEFDLYPDLRAKGESEKAITTMRGNIRISSRFPRPESVVTSVSFSDASPDAATKVTKALVTGLMDEHVRLEESDREASGILPGRASATGTVELILPASSGELAARPKPAILVSLALVEGLQLGLIVALLRGRRSAGSAQ